MLGNLIVNMPRERAARRPDSPRAIAPKNLSPDLTPVFRQALCFEALPGCGSKTACNDSQ
jgi:hypothetical protein